MSTNLFPDTCRWCDRPVASSEGRLVQTTDARQCHVPAHWRRGSCWHAVHADAPRCRARTQATAHEQLLAAGR